MGLHARRTFPMAAIVLVVLGLVGALQWYAPVTHGAGSPTFTNGQNATLVLGQSNFTSNGFATTQSGMRSPQGVAVDPTTGKIFVADRSNNRVLRFASLAALTNGTNAEAVLGQPNFTSGSTATTQSGMNGPCGVMIDSAGHLWVADRNNNRVLRFDSAASKANGANADGVLGQANFTSGTSATTQSGMNNLFQIAIDSAGRLWVADTDNNRVLRFDSAASMANGANADGVLGQPNFTSSTNTATQSGMGAVLGVAADSAGRLWVADYDNSRVLRFDSAASKANGANADGVLGQPNFTSLAFATTQSVMGNPAGVATDSAGRLWVVDSGNSRVLWFDTAASKANGANADGVLGQPNFTSSSIATTQSGMNFPGGVAVDSVGRVWVGDSSNNRVLLFGPPVSSNADLSGLGLSNGTLSPAFAAATTSYTVDVGNGISSLTITPTLADEGATVTVNGVAVSTGSASAAIPLSFGTNTITVVVTASDGVTTKTYTIVVTRATQYSVRLVLVVKP